MLQVRALPMQDPHHCQFDVLAGSPNVVFTRVVGLEPIIQRAGQWTSTCTLLKYAREETQSPHLRHRKRGGRYRGRQGLTFGPFRGLELLRGSCAQFQGCIAMAATPDVSELVTRTHYLIHRSVAVFTNPNSRITIDGRHATVVTACIKRLTSARANVFVRVKAGTPPSTSPLKNADDPAG